MQSSGEGSVGEYRFNVFGTHVAIVGTQGSWRAFYLGAEGKRRAADFIVPGELADDELLTYLDDLFHEDASARNSVVVRLN